LGLKRTRSNLFKIYTVLYIYKFVYICKKVAMKNRIGPPVTGDDFFGREDELDYAWTLLQNGNNLMLPSPRRVGKTSFALELLARAKSENWETLSLNLEENPDEVKFMEQLVEELKKLSAWEQAKGLGNSVLDLLKQLKPSIEMADVTVSMEWKSKKKDVYNQIANILNHSRPTLIFFDEVTVLLNNIEPEESTKKTVGDFLHWLRRLRIEKDSQIRWIFCSSVGIENFTRTHRLSDTVNDFKAIDLKEFTHEKSLEMLQKLGTDNDFELPMEVQQKVVDCLGYCLPYFLQLMFEKVRNLNQLQRLPLRNEIAVQAFADLASGSHFNTWIERIEKQYGVLCDPAFALLRTIAKTPPGCSRQILKNTLSKKITDPEAMESQLSTLLRMLQNDGYLLERAGKYDFRSPLLKAFWFNYFLK